MDDAPVPHASQFHVGGVEGLRRDLASEARVLQRLPDDRVGRHRLERRIAVHHQAGKVGCVAANGNHQFHILPLHQPAERHRLAAG